MGKIIPTTYLVFLVGCFLKASTAWSEETRGLNTSNQTEDEAPSDMNALPSIEETRKAILELNKEAQKAYPASCFYNGDNQCIQAPATAIRDYLRSLRARIVNLGKSGANFEGEKLKNDLSKLGCLNIAIIDLAEVQATVALFRQGVVSRVRVDTTTLSSFQEKCANKLLPLNIHQHEKSKNLSHRGHLNKRRECSEENTRGHHDPGFACGTHGGSLCKQLSIPASSALLGTPMFNGEYQCTPSIYEKRPFACHAGDISGKLGTGVNFSPDESRPDFRFIALDTHGDNPCVASENSQSLVMDCKATDYQIACAPFERVEIAGKRIPELLLELIRAATLAVPHSRDQLSLLASLVLVSEVESRVKLLEQAVPKKPDVEPPSPPENEVN